VEIRVVKREDGNALCAERIPHSEICARTSGGDVKRQYLVLGMAALTAAGIVFAQDQPAKTTAKKTNGKSSGSATKGKDVFDQKCSMCHFADSDAKKIGPGLKGLSKRGTFSVKPDLKVTDENLKNWIENGDSLMPPFKDVLDEQQIKDVIAYVRTL
jgi:mono/diheme cytochrome c family protein